MIPVQENHDQDQLMVIVASSSLFAGLPAGYVNMRIPSSKEAFTFSACTRRCEYQQPDNNLVVTHLGLWRYDQHPLKFPILPLSHRVPCFGPSVRIAKNRTCAAPHRQLHDLAIGTRPERKAKIRLFYAGQLKHGSEGICSSREIDIGADEIFACGRE